MRYIITIAVTLCFSITLFAQDVVNPRPLTMEEYEKAKTFEIKDLDKDTYVKFENTYILDRYEMKKPYFVTGDDGLKKRIDLYKFIGKIGMQELGLFVFYTNEKGNVYKAVVPNFTADGKVWEKYFEDIHAINKVEENFILKLSYILSKELSFQQYKSLNQGKDLSKESATYGNDICFPGDQLVTLSNGVKKELKLVKPGDEVEAINPTSKQRMLIKVKELTTHEAKNYALVKLTLIRANHSADNEIHLSTKTIEATPNHPMLTDTGSKNMKLVVEGDHILCFNENTKAYDSYQVFEKKEYAGSKQPVYNIVANEGDTFIMNDVMVLQK
jgi:hypothetical protein